MDQNAGEPIAPTGAGTTVALIDSGVNAQHSHVSGVPEESIFSWMRRTTFKPVLSTLITLGTGLL